MGCLYLPFFDVSRLTLGTITITRTSFAGVPATLNAITSDDEDSNASSIFQLSTFSGVDGNDVDATVRFRHLAAAGYFAALSTTLRAALIPVWGSHENFNIIFSTSTGLVTISAESAFGVTWSSAAGRALFGFAANITQSTTSYTGTRTPNYCVNCTLDEPSPGTNCIYEPDGLGTHAMSDDGSGTMLARYESPIYEDWVQQYETRLKTFRVRGGHELDASHPYSFQQMYEDCRRFGTPFKLRSDSLSRVYSFRTDGMSFHPQRASEANDTQFHVPFRCIDHGSC